MQTTHNDEKEQDLLAILEDEEAELRFRPLTSGLGLAQSREPKAIKPKCPISTGQSPIFRGELAPFYHDDVPIPVPKITEIPKKNHKEDPIAIDQAREREGHRTFAYSVGIAIVLFAVALTLAGIFFVLGRPWNELARPTLLTSIGLYALCIFVIYYLFYFALVSGKGE